MNWVDVVIIILVLALAFMGWRNGVIKLVFTLAGFIVGLVLAGRLWKQVADLLPISNESVARILGFVIVLAVVMIAAWIAARIVKSLLKVLLLGWVDGLAGAVIGALIGAAAATAVVSAAGIVPSQSVKSAVQDSTLAEPLVKNMGVIYGLLPNEFSSVKDLWKQGANLVDQAATLIENSGKLQELVSQGSQLLEQAGSLQDLLDKAKSLTGSGSTAPGSAVVGFSGLDSFAGDTVYAMVDSGSGNPIGPLSSKVLTGGFAVIAIDGLDSGTAYTVPYYVDGNGNGQCDTGDADVKGTVSLAAGATQAGVQYSGDKGQDSVCDSF